MLESFDTSQLLNWINFLFGGAGFVLASALWKGRNMLIASPKIISPVEDQRVPHEYTYRGTYSQLAKRDDIWLFVCPVKSGRLYPQRQPVTKETHGKWRSVAYVGPSTNEERGDGFVIYTVTANARGTNAILEYVSECLPNERWSGLARWPDGCTQHHSVHVFHGESTSSDA